MPEESLRPLKISETDIIMKLERSRIEALTRRLEMPFFEGWNPEGMDFLRGALFPRARRLR